MEQEITILTKFKVLIQFSVLRNIFTAFLKEIFGYISYVIKKVRFSLLLIFEKNGLARRRLLAKLAHFSQILKVGNF